MAEIVGGIAYTVDLITAGLIEGSRKVKRELDSMSGSFDGFSSKLSGVASAISVLAVAMAALKSAQMADDMRLLGAKVEVAAGSIESGAAAMAALEAISKRTSTSVAANAEVFTRLNQSILQMGGTQQDTLNITELLGKAIRVSGASAVEAKSAMLQFGQALGSGKLAGDELRSLMENAPYLMRQLADGIGVPVGALKGLGEEGKLTADVVTNALTKAATQIDADFQKFPQTIASAMDVAIDAAGRANSKLDELTGTSLALTGITKGVGEVFDELAIQFGEAATEADKLGRNDSIKTWAEAAKFALSYVIDAGDGVVRTFKGVGTSLGGLMAAAGAALSGEFSEARSILGMIGSDLDALASKPLAGQRMRDQFTSGVARPGPVAGPTGKITGNGGKDGKGGKSGKAKTAKKSADEKFDDAGYLASLKKQTVDTWDAITAAETEAVRKSNALLAEKKISVQTHEESLILIARGAAKDRQDLMAKETQDSLSELSAKFEKEQALKEKAIQVTNPVDALRQEYEAKLELVTQYEQMMAQAGVDATMTGDAKRTQLANQFQLQRQAMMEYEFAMQSGSNALLMDSLDSLASSASSSIVGLVNGTMTAQDAMKGLANVVLNEAVGAVVQMGIQYVKSAIIGQATAAAVATAQTAAIATTTTAQVAATGVMATTSIAAAGAVAVAAAPAAGLMSIATLGKAALIGGAALIGTMALAKSFGGNRQYGGPVSSGGLYRVNETGAPEMFTAGNGSQFMLPSSSGKVTSADKVGGGTKVNIVVNNSAPGATASASYDDQTRTVTIAVAEVASQIRANSGPVWSAMRSSSNVAGRM